LWLSKRDWFQMHCDRELASMVGVHIVEINIVPSVLTLIVKLASKVKQIWSLILNRSIL